MVIHSISLKLTSKLTDVEMHKVHLIMTEMEIDGSKFGILTKVPCVFLLCMFIVPSPKLCSVLL